MVIQAKFVHLNLVAENRQTFVAFYQQVFDCVIVPQERDFHGEKLEAVHAIRFHLSGF